MRDSETFRLGDKVRITGHNNREYIGETGILLSAQIIRPAIEGQVITEKVCKIKLDSSDEIVDCLLSQLAKA